MRPIRQPPRRYVAIRPQYISERQTVPRSTRPVNNAAATLPRRRWHPSNKYAIWLQTIGGSAKHTQYRERLATHHGIR